MAQGELFVYSAPAALCSHIQWTLEGVSSSNQDLNWQPHPDALGVFFASASWLGSSDSGSTLASALMNLKQLRFEVIQYPEPQSFGERWSFTEQLGMFHGSTDNFGNIIVSENQLRQAMERAGANALRIQAEIRRILGQLWDDELEPFRELVGGTEGNDGVMSTKAERVTDGQKARPF